MTSGTSSSSASRRRWPGRDVRAFEEGLDVLRIDRPGIPEFGELNARLGARTGWTVVAVPGLVPEDVFFDHLSKRRFPAGNFIRKRSQLDYLEEPDVFHDVFGHVPLLAQPEVADFMQRLGELGLAAMEMGALKADRAALLVHGRVRPRARGWPDRASTAPASSPASAKAASRWKAPSRTGSPSTCGACFAPITGPTASRRAIS